MKTTATDENSGEKEAFNFAGETTKQLITLTSAILALTITFAKDIFVSVPFASKVLLVLAWFVYIFSLLFGMATLGALTGTVGRKPKPDAQGTTKSGIWSKAVTRPAGLQLITFFVGTLTVAVSGLVFAGAEGLKYSERNQLKGLTPVIANALRSRDSNTLSQNLAPDGRFTRPAGDSLSRSQLLADVNANKLSIDELRTERLKTEFVDDTATETGFAGISGHYNGKSFAGTFRYTLLYAKQNDAWKAVFLQVANLQ